MKKSNPVFINLIESVGSNMKLGNFAKGNFTTESHYGNPQGKAQQYSRCIRHLTETHIRSNREDNRTHNIILIDNEILIENNSSKYQILKYVDNKSALNAYTLLVGKKNVIFFPEPVKVIEKQANPKLDNLIKDLKSFGQVNLCEIKDNKLHVNIKTNYQGNALKTFNAIEICNNAFEEFKLIEKCVTDEDKFILILKS